MNIVYHFFTDLGTYVDFWNFYYLFQENLPDLGKHGIIVEVKACGLSVPLGDGGGLSKLIRKLGCNRLPAGQDISGIVRAVGSDVSSLRVGDQVTGIFSLNDWLYSN